MQLKGKTAVVTGGNSGIGAAIVLALAQEGANLVIDFRSHPESTYALESKIASLGGRAIGVEADMSQMDDIQKLISTAVEKFGKLDILVNNAGIETRTSLLDTTEEQYDRVMDVNLKSVFFASQFAAKQMIAQKTGGRILNISSVHEDWPMPHNLPYCLSKGGMKMLTRTAGLELARQGVFMINIGPGAIATPINQSTLNDSELLEKLDQAIPLGRMGKPEEIARVVAFLAGEGASYMTATTVFVDGGLMHQSPGL